MYSINDVLNDNLVRSEQDDDSVVLLVLSNRDRITGRVLFLDTDVVVLDVANSPSTPERTVHIDREAVIAVEIQKRKRPRIRY